MHWLALRQINALELPLPVRLGNPNSLRLGRAVDGARSTFDTADYMSTELKAE